MVYNAAFCRKARRSPYWQPVVRVDRDEIRKATHAKNQSLHSHESAGPSSHLISGGAEHFSITSLADFSSFSSSASTDSTDTESLNTILIELEDEDEGFSFPGTIPFKYLGVDLSDETESDQTMEMVVPEFSEIRPAGTGGAGFDAGPSPSFLIVNKEMCETGETHSVNPTEMEYTTIQFPFGRIFLDPLSGECGPEVINIFLSWLALEHSGVKGVNFKDVAATRSNVVLSRIITAAECPERNARCVCRREPFPFIAGSLPFKLKHVASFETPKIINSAVMSPPTIVKEKDAAVIDSPAPTASFTGTGTSESEALRAKVLAAVKKIPLATMQARIFVQVSKPGKKRSRNTDLVEENAIPLIGQKLDKGTLRALASVRRFQKKEESEKRWLAKQEELLARNPPKNPRTMRSAKNKNDQ